MYIPDGTPFQMPQESAASMFQQESPTTAEQFTDQVTSGFSRKAGSFLAENAFDAADALSNTPKVPADQINAEAPVGNDGKPTHITDEPMYQNVANMLIKDKQRQLVSEDMTSRYSNAHGILPTFAVGAASFMADPSNLAMTAYGGAILGGSKVLAGLGALGVDTASTAARVVARVISGAAGGAASMTPLAAAQYGISAYQGGDYDVKSALSDMAFGAVGGALIHGGFGSALHESGVLKPDELMRAQTLKTDFQSQSADLLRQSAPVKAAAMNSTIADVVNGRPADPSAVIGKDGQPPNLSQIADDRKQQNQNGYSPNMTAEEIAAARQTILPNGLKVEPQPSRLPDTEINRYKETVQTALQNAGVSNVDDSVVQEIARIKAEQISPENAVKPRPLAEVQKEVPKQNVVAVETAPKPVEVEPPAAAANIEPPQSVFTSLAPTKKLQYDHLTAARKAIVAQGIDASRMRIADRQLTIDNPTHAESMHIRDAVQAQHDKYLKNSATGKANYQNRINNAAAKDPTTFKNFLTYLADHGGIKDGDGKGEEKISNLGLGETMPVGMINEDGMSHQRALDKAIEDGWISNKDNPNGTNENELKDLYDLIRDRGKQPHPEADAKQVLAQDRSDNLRLEMDKRGLHYDEKTTDEDAEKILNAHKSLEELGINADGMSLKQMHDAMDMRSAEVTDENNFVEEMKDEDSGRDYYPDMEEPYDEASFEGAHTGHEPEVGASDERSKPETTNTGGGEGPQPVNAGVAGRGATEAEGAAADTGRASADDRAATTFEPAKNVAGGGEQGVLGGMEQSAKQAMAARGEKIGAKVEQKPANEGLFQSVIGGGDELDLRIADAEKTINSSGMTVEERADLQQAYKEAAEADKIYSDKMKELGQCLGENGVA